MSSKTQTTTKKKLSGVLAALVAAALVSAVTLTGCGGGSDKDGSTPDSATETQVVTEIVDGVYVDENGNAITDPSGNPIKATDAAGSKSSGSKSSKADGSKQGSSASGKTESKADTKTESKAADQNSAPTPISNSSKQTSRSNADRKTTPADASGGNTKKQSQEDGSASELTIGGKSYKVGDKVTCTYYLNVPQTMLNFQGRVEYDKSMLKKTGAHLVEPATFGSLINPNLEGRVVFNGSDLSGYDFTDPGYEFLVVEYEVLKTGKTEPAITFEVLTDLSDKAYASDGGALSNGAKVYSVYS